MNIAPTLTDIAQEFGCTTLSIELLWPPCPSGRFHAGEDYWNPDAPARIGDPLYAARDYVVYKLGHDSVIEGHDFGPNAVCLWYPEYHVWHWYGHCNAAYVTLGQTGKAGDHIADVGTLGASTGPHLHSEVRFDFPDPQTIDEIVNGAMIPTAFRSILFSSHPTEDRPMEVTADTRTYLWPGAVESIDVGIGINSALTPTWCNVRNPDDKESASGTIVFVRRSDGAPLASAGFDLPPGAGAELGVGLPTDQVREVGSWVVQWTTGARLTVAHKEA